MFKGSCVALVTPMKANGEIDENCFENLIKWHILQGTAAIVVAGSTGEGATLTSQEKERLFALAVKISQKKIPIIAGTGTNSTVSTIEQTLMAQKIGVDACLVVTPYYNRPTQKGLIEHYRALAHAVEVPILLYNVPSRTGCDMLPETVKTLSETPNIVGIKEATGLVERVAFMKENCKKNFMLYSGDDPTVFEFIAQGGDGVISIVANVAPQLMQNLCLHALNKENDKAQEIDNMLYDLHRLMCIEPNPIPVKWALNSVGKIPEGIRLPLTPLSTQYHEKITQALQAVGMNK